MHTYSCTLNVKISKETFASNPINDQFKKTRLCKYLVERAQSEPTATAYFAPSHPMYLKATGNGLFLSSK